MHAEGLGPGEGCAARGQLLLQLASRGFGIRRFGDLGLVEGKVEFSGIVKEVNLSYTPEVEEGQYVVVHVGFAISILDEEDALKTLEYLEQLGELIEREGL